MKRLISFFALMMMLWAGPALATDAADRSAIQNVITSQITAFQKDDAEEAFSYAAPSIQKQFGSASGFMSMVRHGYDPVYRPSAYDFGKLGQAHGKTVQEVFLTDSRGRTVVAYYAMQQQPDGSWRISGVQLRKASGQAA